jgi:hypothetical protein
MARISGHPWPGRGYSKRALYRKHFGSGVRGPDYRTWTPPVGMKWRGRKKNKTPLHAKPARRNFDIGSY